MYQEVHPFQEFIPPKAKYLIVGSFPPIKLTVESVNSISGENKHLYEQYFSAKRNQKKEGDIDFYYGSSNNMFWDLVGATFGLEIKSKDAMISFLTKNFIGITDLVEKCHRGPQVRTTAKMRKNNSSLSSLDSDLIIKEYRDVIRSIIDNNIKIVYCTSAFVKKHLSYIDKFNELKCKIVVLSSPSPSYSRSIGRMEKYKDMVKDGLVKNTKEYRILEYRDIFKDIL